MAKSEVVDTPLGAIDGVNTLFTVQHSYVPGTVSVYLNGLLRKATADDGWTEQNPATGAVLLNQAPAPLDVVQIAYTTNEVVYVDPNKPVHVSKLVPGDVVDVVMKAGRHLNQIVRSGTIYLEVTEEVRRIAGATSKTALTGFISFNDRTLGYLRVQFKDHGVYKLATVQYQSVLLLYKRTVGTKKRVRVYF